MRKHKSEVTLKNVEKIKNYFMKEIDQNELMSKKQKDFYNCKLYSTLSSFSFYDYCMYFNCYFCFFR